MTPQRYLNLINLYGFTLLRNGVKYDYSFKESLESLKPIVNKVYLALDIGDDTTQEVISTLPYVKVLDSVWDMNLRKGLVLSVETNKALQYLRSEHADLGDWGIYLQADEVLHQDDYELLINDINIAEKEGYDAISFRYLHFWQTHHHIAISKKWYPEEIRAIKLNSKIVSWGDAQGFKNYTKVYQSEARIYHYGHVREEDIYKTKMIDMGKMYHNQEDLQKNLDKGLKDAQKNKTLLYFGSHPMVMKERVLKMKDIWVRERVKEAHIVGNSEKYSEKLIEKINADKVIWYKNINEVPKEFRNQMIVTNPTILDSFLLRTKVPKKMKSKIARNWSDDFRFVLQVSEKNIGFIE